jgi:hypothetical protein
LRFFGLGVLGAIFSGRGTASAGLRFGLGGFCGFGWSGWSAFAGGRLLLLFRCRRLVLGVLLLIGGCGFNAIEIRDGGRLDIAATSASRTLDGAGGSTFGARGGRASGRSRALRAGCFGMGGFDFGPCDFLVLAVCGLGLRFTSGRFGCRCRGSFGCRGYGGGCFRTWSRGRFGNSRGFHGWDLSGRRSGGFLSALHTSGYGLFEKLVELMPFARGKALTDAPKDLGARITSHADEAAADGAAGIGGVGAPASEQRDGEGLSEAGGVDLFASRVRADTAEYKTGGRDGLGCFWGRVALRFDFGGVILGGHPPIAGRCGAAALHGVGQLMREKVEALARFGTIAAAVEDDVAADGEGLRVESASGVCCLATGVDADVGEVAAEERFHLEADAFFERFAGFGGGMVDEGGGFGGVLAQVVRGPSTGVGFRLGRDALHRGRLQDR